MVLALVALLALSANPPGTPKPAMGAPSDKPGNNDPFGTQGGKVEEDTSHAEDHAEAAKPTVERIDIIGNESATDTHIRHHLMLQEGDELDEDDVKLSRVRLMQLGIFEAVDAEVRQADNGHDVIVIIAVKEKNRFAVTDLLYGSTVSTKFYAGAGFAVSDLLNSGVSFSLGGLYGGPDRYAGRLTAYLPDLNINGISFVAGLQLLGQRNVENACGAVDCWRDGTRLDYARLGGEFDVGFRLGNYQRFIFGYRYEALNAGYSAEPAPGDEPIAEGALPYIHRGQSRISGLVFAFDRDARNETFLPTRGSRVQAEVKLSTRALHSSYDYARFLAQYEQWVPQGGGRAWRLDFAGGLVQGDAPFFERFFAADWSYFALGYATPRLYDMNFSPDPRYDRVLLLTGMEYDFPLWRTPSFVLKRGYLALGGRFVYTSAVPGGSRTMVSSIPFSADASIRVESPFGLVSFSLGYLTDLIF